MITIENNEDFVEVEIDNGEITFIQVELEYLLRCFLNRLEVLMDDKRENTSAEQREFEVLIACIPPMEKIYYPFNEVPK